MDTMDERIENFIFRAKLFEARGPDTPNWYPARHHPGQRVFKHWERGMSFEESVGKMMEYMKKQGAKDLVSREGMEGMKRKIRDAIDEFTRWKLEMHGPDAQGFGPRADVVGQHIDEIKQMRTWAGLPEEPR